MSLRLAALRFLALTLLAIWLGGFTFYSAAVIPVLHDAVGSVQGGSVTQHVTNRLNAVGGVTLLVWWALAVQDRDGLTPAWKRRRTGLLCVTAGLLLALAALHAVMDERLSRVGLRGFYPLHRAYLITSTVQWLVNLGLLATEAARGGPGDRA